MGKIMKTESIVLTTSRGIPSDDVFRYETVEIDEPSKMRFKLKRYIFQ